MNCVGEDAKSKAGDLMNLVPGNNVLTKTGVLSLVAGLTAYGISKEVIVLHNETLLVVGTGVVLSLAYNKLSGPFQEWADSEREELRKKLNSSIETKKRFLNQQIEDARKASQIQQVIEGFYSASKVNNPFYPFFPPKISLVSSFIHPMPITSPIFFLLFSFRKSP